MAKPIAYCDPNRKLAKIVTIENIIKHPNADALDIAFVEGWQVVTALGKWKVGDKALFCEVGSLLPISIPVFYSAGRDGNVKTFNEVQYAYIKTIKLRKEISQGFLCDIPSEHAHKPVGTVLSKELGVLKYESNPSGLILGAIEAGVTKKNLVQRIAEFIGGPSVTNFLPFPDGVKQSSETRVQSMLSTLNAHQRCSGTFEASVKLDGNSMTLHFIRKKEGILEPEDIEVKLLSRDCEISLKPIQVGIVRATRLFVAGCIMGVYRRFNGASKIHWPKFQTVIPVSDDPFTRTYRKLMDDGLLERVRMQFIVNNYGTLTVQGELIGPDVIAGDRVNYEGVDETHLRLYRCFTDGEMLVPARAQRLAQVLGFKSAPVIDPELNLEGFSDLVDVGLNKKVRHYNVKKLLAYAEGPRVLTKGGQREGVVLKCNRCNLSTKIISNAFLLKNGDA